MSAHFRVASMDASMKAHNPYRKNFLKEPLLAPKITFKTRIVSTIIRLKNKTVKVLFAWKKPTASRTIRRVVRKTSTQAKNKADPHLDKRAG